MGEGAGLGYITGGKTAKAATPDEEKNKLEAKEALEPENMTDAEKERLKALRAAKPEDKKEGSATQALKE
jgi:hypothetical protein